MRRRKKSALHVSSYKFDPENVRPLSGMDWDSYPAWIGVFITIMSD
jgi:hypothetical protein